MTRKKAFNIGSLRAMRKLSGLNQQEYWTRYGITQSGGSRYESGRNVPKPASMLIWLHVSGRIADEDLQNALKAVR
jgi:hypothetical protein